MSQAYHGRGTFCSERMIQRHNSKNIAVVTTYISDYIFPRLIQGMDRVLTANGYSIILKNTGNSRTNEAKVLQELLDKPIDGLIIEPSKSQILCRHLNLYQMLDQYEIPYVFIQGSYPQMMDRPHILMDDCKGGYLLTKYLLGTGHRKIVGVFKADDSQGAQRHLGYARALNEAGISYDPEMVIWFHTEDRKQKPGLMMKLFLEAKREFDAVVCYNDQIAILVIRALREQGVRIPEDVSVTGYDNSAMAGSGEIGLTTHRPPPGKAGRDGGGADPGENTESTRGGQPSRTADSAGADCQGIGCRQKLTGQSPSGRVPGSEGNRTGILSVAGRAKTIIWRGNNMSMDKNTVVQAIESGKTALGIEFGSTRIKAVLVGEDNAPVASGSHDWENRYENGIWTYTLEDIWGGLQDCYQKLAEDVKSQYSVTLKKIGAIGFSAMMHGYMAFDKDGKLLVPFRTWRNSITEEASEKLTELFQYNIPQRWSIAHLYQAILNGEEHVPQIDFLTTLDGYVHWKLTGEKTLGIGEASGMFPIDSETKTYRQDMMDKFEALIAEKHYPWKLSEILPKVLVAGEHAGTLTAEGAQLLDVSGNLEAGVPLCPSEGDAGTGMVATNSVTRRTGNVSAGTSVFAMVVLEKELSRVYPEIDMVTTPTGNPVAMVHANNCTSDLNAWVGIFKEFAEAFGIKVDMNELFKTPVQQSAGR